MRDNIALLRGIVRDTNAVAAWRNIRLYNGRAQGSNGAITVDVPFECGDLDVTVPGEKFITAMVRTDAPALKMMPSGRLQIKAGAFKLSLPVHDNKTFPISHPDGEKFEGGSDMLDAFKIARPFTGGERVWLNGVHIRNGYVYATNGFAVVRVQVDTDMTVDGTVPTDAIAKVIAMKQPITAMRVSDLAVAFKLGDDMWLRAQLITESAPDMERLIADCTTPVPPGLAEAVEQIAPYLVGKYPVVDLGPAGITAADSGTATVAVDMPGLPVARFRADLLQPVLQYAKYLDIGTYPQPCPWNDGGRVYGAIVGVSP